MLFIFLLKNNTLVILIGIYPLDAWETLDECHLDLWSFKKISKKAEMDFMLTSSLQTFCIRLVRLYVRKPWPA